MRGCRVAVVGNGTKDCLILGLCAVDRRRRCVPAAPFGERVSGRERAGLHPTRPLALLRSLLGNQNLKALLAKRVAACCVLHSRERCRRKNSAVQLAGLA